MGYTAKDVCRVAEQEIGYIEKATNYNLDDKYANPGQANFQKYGRDLFEAGYYNGNKNGYEWCDQFVDWVHYIASGKNRKLAEQVECQSGTTGGAGCTWSRQYYKNHGRLSSTPLVGDQAFFSESQKSDPDNADHTGIVVSVDGNKVTTIEGNSSNKVSKLVHTLNDGWLYDFGHPLYEDSEFIEQDINKNNNMSNISDVYVVASGDTLSEICSRFNLSIEDVASWNNIADINDIDVGQVILLKKPHSVKSINKLYPQSTQSDESYTWHFINDWLNNEYGTAGLIGNLYAESGLVANNLQNYYEQKLGYSDISYTDSVDNGSYDNFIHDDAGYGIAQWTYYSRKKDLLEFASKYNNSSIGNLDMQLHFLRQELENQYPSLVNKLKTATSIYDASSYVLTEFERPYDMSDSVKRTRSSYGQEFYNKFSTVEGDIQDGGLYIIRKAQQFYNSYIGSKLDVDGEWGPLTNDAAVRSLQKAVGTDVDGEIGPNTISCINKNMVKLNSRGDVVKVLQASLSKFGYALDIDGFAGVATIECVEHFQNMQNIEKDGIAGPDTFIKLLS